MIEYQYIKGEGIPDIPVVYLKLILKEKKLGGPAIIDTGFDGGIYPNAVIYSYFKKHENFEKGVLEDVSGEIECRVIRGEAEIFHPDADAKLGVGGVNVYLPVDEENLTENVIIGREILNRLDIRLDGKTVKIY